MRRRFLLLAPLLSTIYLVGMCKSSNTANLKDLPPSALQPDWSANFALPLGTDRANIYGLSATDFQQTLQKGRIHTLIYPVEPTGLIIPWYAFDRFLSGTGQGLMRTILGSVASGFTGYHSMDDLSQWLGLYKYPLPSEQGPYPFSIPYPNGNYPSYRIGMSQRDTAEGTGATFGCATCHSGHLFGRHVLGLTNRFPRANEFFSKAKVLLPRVPAALFQRMTGATAGEKGMYERSVRNLQWVQPKAPSALGLDTSLAQVSLSLSLRETDEYAEKTQNSAAHPRENMMAHFAADSKPAVWWNLKYKTRWLSDGSVVSGNPIFTNFLWNEIGRGVDLHELEAWMLKSKEVEREITAAVFATEAPRWTDFFNPDSIPLEKAKHGELLFNQTCAPCHGRYEKAWSTGEQNLTQAELLRTTRVVYHEKTPVMNVGTDENRAKGMTSFADRLNNLKISREMGTRIETQDGYVPPPLVGIWARWPYFHNNAAPSLCAVLSKSEDRPKTFWMGEPLERDRDFDQDCVGYPGENNVPASWREAQFLFDTSKPGLSNSGHDRGILLDNEGAEKFSPADKQDIITLED